MRRIPVLLAFILALACLAGCAGTEPPADSTEPSQTVSGETPAAESPDAAQKEEPEGMQTETYYLGTEDRILAYIPNCVKDSADGTVPLVLNLHWTSGTPEEQVSENGWLVVSEKEGFLMIAPFYGSYDSVYNHTDYFAEIVKDALKRYPMIDKSRVYVTGFSNGGAAAVALTDQCPELFAAIAPEGWMVGMRDWRAKGADYDMPFQIIQGTDEYTYTTDSGAMAIMRDEQEALSDLMLFNEMAEESFTPDYDATPYWGYPADSTEVLQFDGKDWTVSNYRKDGFTAPFGQLILVQDGIHWARKPHAQLAWDFMKHFRRNEQGEIVEISEEMDMKQVDFSDFPNVELIHADLNSMSDEQLAVLYEQARYCQAMTEADTDTLRELVPEDATFTHMSGRQQTREEYFADIENGNLRYFTIGIDSPVVTVEGDTASATFTSVLNANAYGAAGTYRMSGTHHWEKRDGEWVVAGNSNR